MRNQDKLNRCAGDRQVIVLTHTPVNDWMSDTCNPNWIYINGHTHQNSLIRKQDGTTVLSDNQVGYKPSKWKLNGFTVSGQYDPFKDMPDGMYEITSEMYKDFNQGRGIKSNGCNFPGRIYALKKCGFYMFLLESASSLCLLVGGQRRRLENCAEYYYDYMDIYARKVVRAIAPYQNALRAIAKEVKKIGGWGNVHGCIVDIDFYHHIYLNPYDGTLTPYFAYDVTSRLTYADLPSLLRTSLPSLNKNYIEACKKGELPLLKQYEAPPKKKTKRMPIATVPKLVLGTEMYDPSRIMRAIQYIFEDDVIRIWEEHILTIDPDENTAIEAKYCFPK